jgi:hypothetical protein
MRGARKRPLTKAERQLARSVFGDAIDLDRVAINRRAWWLLQPKNVIMAPDGEIWCHPRGTAYRQCFANSSPSWQALFVHEMVHVWQAQKKGRWYLPLSRHPFCPYRYELTPGKPFDRYGVEQQAEIVKHAFMLRQGWHFPGGGPIEHYDAILPFDRAA